MRTTSVPAHRARLIRASLVHHTGTIIRFRPRQYRVGELPAADRGVVVVLPDGTRLSCKFRAHPANPNFTGRKLVRWIKQRLPFGGVEPIVLREAVGHREYHIEVLSVGSVQALHDDNLLPARRDETWEILRALLAAVEKEPLSKRRRTYAAIERKTGPSVLVKRCFGHACQVEDCVFTGHADAALNPLISEVHHLEHLSARGTWSPYNLAVLCANHHALLHRDRTAKIVQGAEDDVCVECKEGKIWIRRDLRRLR